MGCFVLFCFVFLLKIFFVFSSFLFFLFYFIIYLFCLFFEGGFELRESLSNGCSSPTSLDSAL